jgi:hypothetical protein
MTTRTGGGAIENSIKRLLQLKINFLAIDFDCTLIDLHTGGRWAGTAEELLAHVRPEFRQLVMAACSNNIHISIVTFTPQTAMVKGVLENIVGTERAERIPIRSGDRTWSYQGAGSHAGKQAHMASAVEELEQNGQVEITKNSTVLIDDDQRNVRHALKDGVRAIWFNPEKPHHLMRDLARLV